MTQQAVEHRGHRGVSESTVSGSVSRTGYHRRGRQGDICVSGRALRHDSGPAAVSVACRGRRRRRRRRRCRAPPGRSAPRERNGNVGCRGLMKSRLIIIVFLLSSVVQAEERTSKQSHWPKWLEIGCLAADLASTEWVLLNGGREMNPLVRHRGVRLSVNISLSTWMFKTYEPEQKEAALVVSAMRCGFAAWNVSRALRSR